MKITIEIEDGVLDQLAALIAGKIGGEKVEDDLAGGDAPEEKKATLTDVQDAIRRAGAVNKDKTKAVLAKYVPKGKEPRGTNLEESKFQAVIDELAKIK